MTDDQIALMQTQDIKYIIHKRTIEKKKIEKLQATLHLLDYDHGVKNTHTFFVDSESEKSKFDPAARLNTHPSLLDRAFNRPTYDALKSKILDMSSEEGNKLKEKAYNELTKRIEREKQLGILQEKMEIKRILKDGKKKAENKPEKLIAPETKESAPVFKWATERKK